MQERIFVMIEPSLGKATMLSFADLTDVLASHIHEQQEEIRDLKDQLEQSEEKITALKLCQKTFDKTVLPVPTNE